MRVHDARAVARPGGGQRREHQRRAPAPRRPQAIHAPSRDDWLQQTNITIIISLQLKEVFCWTKILELHNNNQSYVFKAVATTMRQLSSLQIMAHMLVSMNVTYVQIHLPKWSECYPLDRVWIRDSFASFIFKSNSSLQEVKMWNGKYRSNILIVSNRQLGKKAPVTQRA